MVVAKTAARACAMALLLTRAIVAVAIHAIHIRSTPCVGPCRVPTHWPHVSFVHTPHIASLRFGIAFVHCSQCPMHRLHTRVLIILRSSSSHAQTVCVAGLVSQTSHSSFSSDELSAIGVDRRK